MGFFSKLFGFRWSLYIVKNGNQLIYAMHANSVMVMTGYVSGNFARGGRPVEPWSLYLNFNHTHQTIKLGPEHFSPVFPHLTTLLIQQIKSIDPDYDRMRAGGPIFQESATKKRIKISNYSSGKIDVKAIFENINKPREVTFFTIMDEVFGKTNNS